jgi:polyphosphate glucokinase
MEVHALTNCDRMYLGGGNSRRFSFALPPWATIVPPSSGVAGGARLWHADMDRWFSPDRAATEEARVRR